MLSTLKQQQLPISLISGRGRATGSFAFRHGAGGNVECQGNPKASGSGRGEPETALSWLDRAALEL